MANSLHQKLLAVQKAVSALPKDGFNPHHEYEYVSSSAVNTAVRSEMDEQGPLLVHTVTKVELDTDGKRNLIEMWLDFTWIDTDDPQQRETYSAYAYGLDAGEQAVGKALTYAEKNFLLKTFHVGTPDDDPDAYERPKPRSAKKQQAPAQKPQTAGAETLGETGKAKFDAWLEDKPKPIWAAMNKELPGFLQDHFDVNTIDQVPASGGKTLLGWAHQRCEQLPGELEEQEHGEFLKLQEQAEQMGIPTEGLDTVEELRDQIAKVEKAKAKA